jgi:hypothetical protein
MATTLPSGSSALHLARRVNCPREANPYLKGRASESMGVVGEDQSKREFRRSVRCHHANRNVRWSWSDAPLLDPLA